MFALIRCMLRCKGSELVSYLFLHIQSCCLRDGDAARWLFAGDSYAKLPLDLGFYCTQSHSLMRTYAVTNLTSGVSVVQRVKPSD